MKQSIRYGDFLGVVRLKQRAISYNELARAVRAQTEGADYVAFGGE